MDDTLRMIATLPKLSISNVEKEPRTVTKRRMDVLHGGSNTQNSIKRKNNDPHRRSNKKYSTEPRLYPSPHGKALIEVEGKKIEARVTLNSGSNVFLMSPMFCNKWKVLKVQKDVAAAIQAFPGDVFAGAVKAVTKHPR